MLSPPGLGQEHTHLSVTCAHTSRQAMAHNPRKCHGRQLRISLLGLKYGLGYDFEQSPRVQAAFSNQRCMVLPEQFHTSMATMAREQPRNLVELLRRQFSSEILRRHLRGLPIFRVEKWLPDRLRNLVDRLSRKGTEK
ncbi:hypothetical protein [Mesorhizobium sp. 113-3-9]|uniref:hypothetical protein n=1 Tax=Mesorhizobium sp. 113-3-9 TaxID=2744517 RepID=UPI001FD3C9D2|nr:hypothetical protein [Mesorhizobium sp. 113-3-9]